MEISRLTRDGTAEPVSRYQILRHVRGQGNAHFLCSADHEHEWKPCLVDPYSAICDDHIYIHTYEVACTQCTTFDYRVYTVFFCFSFNLTYSRWTSSLPSCLWSLRILPSLPGSRLTIFYRYASSALLKLVGLALNFTYSRSHAFRYERMNTNPT